jgi:dTDP-6-deoxy-L-talose 4-dehydrogenase (NAD+)
MLTYPTNYYALAKDTLRKMLEIHQLNNKFDFKWVRLFYMHGFGQSANSLIPQLEKALFNREQIFNMSGGEQIRDYLPVTDVAQNIIKIALQSEICGIINNCSGSPKKVIDLIKEYLKDKNKNINLNLGYYPYSVHEPMVFWGNNRKLKTIK